MMMLHSAAVTDMGRVRQNNEDNYYLCGAFRQNTDSRCQLDTDDAPRDHYLFSVCDGMGGEQLGELASLIAVSALDEYRQDFDASVDAYVRKANKRICAEIEKNGGARIGTTFAALSVTGEAARAYNIGDSRVYLLRDGVLTQLSEDHTQVQRLFRQGIITAEQMRTHPERHKLTQHMGIFPEEMIIEPFTAPPVTTRPEDRFLLCSDGLTDMLTDEEIAALLTEGKTPENCVDALVTAALNNGGRDNVTVVVAEVQKERERVQIPTPDTAKIKARQIFGKFKEWLNEDTF